MTETEGKLKAAAAVAAARREQELTDVDHQATLQRRVERLRIEMAREQSNLEAIQKRALEYAEGDSGNTTAREIDEDWLFRFADFAQKVSDGDVQALWARVASSAAMQGSTLLSAAGLQTLALFDKRIAENFQRFTAAARRLGFVPHVPDGEAEPQQIDRATLLDLGLIRETMFQGAYKFADFRFEASEKADMTDLHAHMALTLRGSEIARAVFRKDEDIPLSEEHEQQYLRHVLLQEFQHKKQLALLPRLPDGSLVSATISKESDIRNMITAQCWWRKTSPVVSST
ncbi:hypothetical protein XH79_26845 [Bradyrhizobium sp. CCBAU 45389]|nr:hypothetical protein [Bradyrhizobium sp. CCBAU 45389]